MNKKYIDYIPLLVLFIFHSILDIWFILKDTRPPAWDQSAHLILTQAYLRGYNIQTTSNYYPPGFHLSALPFYGLFGQTYDAGCLVNILYLSILIFSVYGIGKTLFNREVGLYSALIISFIPMLVSLRRDFLIDFGLVSAISLAIYLLLKTKNFNNLKYSLAFGAGLGFMVLVKWIAIFFVFAPLCCVLWQCIKEPKYCAYCGRLLNSAKKIIRNGFLLFCSERHKQKFLNEGRFILTNMHNFIFSILIFVVVAGFWYLPNFAVFRRLIRASSYYGAVEGDPTGIMGFWFYINAVNIQSYLFFSVLMIIGLLAFFLKFKDVISRDKRLLVGFSILIPFIVFSIAGNKDTRYTLPILIFLVLVAGYWIASLKNPKKVAVLGAVTLIGILQLSTITFGMPAVSIPYHFYPNPVKPQQGDWQVEKILGIIAENAEKSPVNVLMLYNHPYINWKTLEYYAFREKLPFIFYYYEYPGRIEQHDFVLYAPDAYKNQFKEGTIQREQLYKANYIFESHINEFRKIKEVELPNKVKIQIYKKK